MTPGIQKKVTDLLGLCLRAGQLETGQESGVALIRSGAAGIVFVDAAASANTRKRIADACRFRQVPAYEMEEGAIGHAIGKTNRLIAVIRQGGFANKLLPALQGEQQLNEDTNKNAGVQTRT